MKSNLKLKLAKKDNLDLTHKIEQLKNYLLQQFPEQDLILSDNTNSSRSFFQPIKPIGPISIQLLNTTLQEHFQCLLKYKAPTIHSETLYKDLLRFIQTHCKEQVETNHARNHLKICF
ncbi:hypothetical protein [Rickettsiella endosymbiont of Litargus connexus]|jgi:hypothetical protein|uniref:hypothetical protein n=1 Tax=Rickettsiella endosymbiont of Litargus connexus TaxID=3066237 RepID=UPI00376ECA77|nr:hypothetical protein [Gammaproteobacteria bacterium]MDD5162440.1 hypothetical protein [Candidatus Rickettsiella isopodorum]